MWVDNPLLKDAEKYPDLIPIFQKVKGIDILHGKKSKNFMKLKFKDVEFIKQTIQEPNDKAVLKCLKIVFGFVDVEKLRLLEFYQSYNHIVEQIKIILESEKNLHTEPSERLKNAGIDRMSIFGALNILDDIGQKYGVPPHKVEKWTYGLIFSLSLKAKYEADIKAYLDRNEH